LKRHSIQIDETIATVIIADEFVPLASQAVFEAREQLIGYIIENPEFEGSLKPLSVSKGAPPLVQKMAEAGQAVGVGPMAAVAGAIAEYVVDRLVGSGAQHVVFDNGGDIAMYLQKPIVAGVYAGPNGVDGIGLKITRTNEILGLCTSSGTVGHSLSFGCSDAAITISRNVALADAAATALGNLVTTRDSDLIVSAMRNAMVQDIEGVMVIIGDAIGTCGRLPDIVRARVDYNLISKGLEV
jgi:ApbE superfamily uncharacterized protein (UPF0280 family)